MSRAPLGGGVSVGDIGLCGGWSSSGFSVFGAGSLVSWGGNGALSGLLYWVLYCLVGIIKS